MPGFESPVLAAWDFDTNFAGREVLLSFDIGLGGEDMDVWHLDDGGNWSLYSPAWMTYDAGGVLSFPVTDFSGYAVAGIPEPATVGLLALGGLALLRRR